MSSPEENESFSSGLCRKNIETLLAAVAQTQGFDDDEAVTTTTERTGGDDNGGASSSAAIRDVDDSQVVGAPTEIDGDVMEQQPYTVVMCLPAVRGGQQMCASGGKRKRARKENGPVVVSKSSPPKQEKQEVEEVGVLPAVRAGQQMVASGEKRKRGRQAKGPAASAAKLPRPKREKEEEDVCFICFDGGSLVLCDRRGCPKAYHPACIKRDEKFFSSTAIWNCGWHICTLCMKSSHYMCFTCTFSLCKGCTKDADYVCVRGSKGFCATCMKTIMLIENKDQANNESVQVDFDDKTSWEYLFKVYWVCLKEKLSLTMSELTQAKKPWKEAAAVPRKRRLYNVDLNGHGKKDSNSYRSSGLYELNKSQELDGLVNKDPLRIEVPSIKKDRETSNKNGADEMSHNVHTCQPIIDKIAVQSVTNRGLEKPSIEKGMDKPSIDKGTGWVSKDLVQERSPQKNLDEYAAINFQNISLIYLRRNLMETLIKDKEKFHDMVIGSFVRIRISNNDQKEDFYRLVQVVGTDMVAEPHKIGFNTTDIMLEVLNLGKKEALSIDAISDQEFSEDECRQLCQSIRHGLGKPLTIGDVQKKAMALQAVRLNEPLEAEILQLNRLLRQANEEGQKKELSECIEEIQLLKLEHQQKLCEVPEIHADPKMSPNYDSEEDNKLGNNSIEKGLIQVVGSNRSDEKIDASGSQSWEKKYGSQVNISSLETGGSDQAMMKSGLETSITTGSKGNSSSANIIETENLWHYRDPNGKIQGPFSMIHLRKWSMTGLFPPDLRIWTNHEEYDSVLLNSALNGRFHEASKLADNISSESQEFEAISDNRFVSCDTEVVRADASGSPLPHLGFKHCTQHGEKNLSGRIEIQTTGGNDCENKESQVGQSSQENLSSVSSSKNMESSSDFVPTVKSPPNLSKHGGGIDLSRPPLTPETSIKEWEIQTAEKQQSVCSDVALQSSGIFKLPSDASDEWCGYDPPHAKASVEEWDSGLVSGSSLKPPKSLGDADTALANMLTLSSSSHHTSDITSWQPSSNEKIEIDALGEDLVSDLLTQVMESQGGLPSPTSAIKFEKELIQDCNDGCFSSIEFSLTCDPGKSDALSSSGEIHLTCQSQANAPDPFRSSCVQSSASSEGETSGPVHRADSGSEIHPPAPNISQDMVGTTLALGTGSETVDPGWGTVQGNINLVTVQGNVNLVLGGPTQGMPNLGFTNSGTSWGNPNMNRSAQNGSLPWDNQWKIGGERFTGPRDWGNQSGDQGFGRGRPPWGRHPYGGGGGYSRPLPKGQRVCKFYESGRCKKGAFCDYLHP
ncbi:zinc finger CCCH domain-containing protein 44-like isoform X2 [Olea europaea var. sylvestris]|uniref:zinc finger CCCH domain-containing protein 44-like isoform X2 n=1 Tax=Olea europaea var. sylvestris TaxID=158386 RepID=UPI000C1CF5D0|nr:zinc finger CCCH domain-containing protein 44-like isoform X2 [Olea europaea var. sylvestris]